MAYILFSNSAYLEHDQNSNEQATNEFRGTFRHEKDIIAKINRQMSGKIQSKIKF